MKSRREEGSRKKERSQPGSQPVVLVSLLSHGQPFPMQPR